MEASHPEPSPQPTAQEAYRENYGRICDVLLRVTNKLYGDYHNPDQPKTWADVGDQGHVLELLEELAEFLGV